MESLRTLANELSRQIGTRLEAEPAARVGGGSINECYRWESRGGPVFVKVTHSSRLPMFEAEAAGLQELAAAGAVRVPSVLATGCTAEVGDREGDPALPRGQRAVSSTVSAAYLVLEWIDRGTPDRRTEHRAGEAVAALHAVRAAQFGWDRDNTIGLTPQLNARMSDWAAFFREQRLRYQLELAAKNGYRDLLEPLGEPLLESVDTLLEHHRPRPALLHGDLWGGNWFADSDGEPVFFDPAVYYGDPEADLAMTRLFGGFGRAFYEAYEAVAPPEAGAETRFELYNLYHVLNHANLFGGSYVRQARSMMQRLLAVAGR